MPSTTRKELKKRFDEYVLLRMLLGNVGSKAGAGITIQVSRLYPLQLRMAKGGSQAFSFQKLLR